jgi:hypothetical protein
VLFYDEPFDPHVMKYVMEELRLEERERNVAAQLTYLCDYYIESGFDEYLQQAKRLANYVVLPLARLKPAHIALLLSRHQCGAPRKS